MQYTYRHIVKTLKKNGWYYVRTTGSHEIYRNEQGKTCPVKCTDKTIPTGTVRNIERITGVKF